MEKYFEIDTAIDTLDDKDTIDTLVETDSINNLLQVLYDIILL